ncbi:hypothetical protein [Streptomyces sp. NPDC006638]|uniref:hypothetical protein n=1 Tax=Streptomyces sp. NPDC006638 TaxID=3157183 RepID=UPI0033B6A634
MSRSSSGIVAGLTAAAIAGVAFLAYQASASVPDTLGKNGTPSASSPTASASPAPKKDPLTVPAASGTGRRVVYGLKDRRVWLVDRTNQATRTFPVVPSTLNPAPGSYTVNSRSAQVQGSDGVLVEHVVRFATAEGATVGFSAAVDGSLPTPNPALRTGGVRMKRADGAALWSFATINSTVVVVP